MFTQGKTIKVNNQTFEITRVVTISEAAGGGFELIGTKQGDPSFLAGKRTIFTNYLTQTKSGYVYDWTAR